MMLVLLGAALSLTKVSPLWQYVKAALLEERPGQGNMQVKLRTSWNHGSPGKQAPAQAPCRGLYSIAWADDHGRRSHAEPVQVLIRAVAC